MERFILSSPGCNRVGVKAERGHKTILKVESFRDRDGFITASHKLITSISHKLTLSRTLMYPRAGAKAALSALPHTARGRGSRPGFGKGKNLFKKLKAYHHRLNPQSKIRLFFCCVHFIQSECAISGVLLEASVRQETRKMEKYPRRGDVITATADCTVGAVLYHIVIRYLFIHQLPLKEAHGRSYSC